MSVLESAPVSSTVGRVLAKDMDEGINAEMKYSLVDGDGLDAFDIMTDPNYQVGIITVRKVMFMSLSNAQLTLLAIITALIIYLNFPYIYFLKKPNALAWKAQDSCISSCV